MRLLIILMLFSLIYIVSGKTNEKPSGKKPLTESMGQEVIEIGTPIKELPMGLEEEPAADDDDEKKITSNTPQPSNKKDAKKTTTLSTVKKEVKYVEKIEGLNAEDDEARIEKELAEIYKDTADYKSDSSEEKDVAKETPIEQHSEEATSAEETEKPIARQRNVMKFQPDSTRKSDIEKFRTSIDDINCNSKQKLSATQAPKNGAFDTFNHGISITIAMFYCLVICT